MVLLCGHACGPGMTGWHARSRGSLARGGEWFARGVVYALFALVFDLLSYFQYLDLTLKIIHTMNNKR